MIMDDVVGSLSVLSNSPPVISQVGIHAAWRLDELINVLEVRVGPKSHSVVMTSSHKKVDRNGRPVSDLD